MVHGNSDLTYKTVAVDDSYHAPTAKFLTFADGAYRIEVPGYLRVAREVVPVAGFLSDSTILKAYNKAITRRNELIEDVIGHQTAKYVVRCERYKIPLMDNLLDLYDEVNTARICPIPAIQVRGSRKLGDLIFEYTDSSGHTTVRPFGNHQTAFSAYTVVRERWAADRHMAIGAASTELNAKVLNLFLNHDDAESIYRYLVDVQQAGINGSRAYSEMQYHASLAYDIGLRGSAKQRFIEYEGEPLTHLEGITQDIRNALIESIRDY